MEAGNISPSSKTEAGGVGGVGGNVDSSDSPVFDDSEVIRVCVSLFVQVRVPAFLGIGDFAYETEMSRTT